MFFTAVNPMLIDQHGERDYDVTQPRIAVDKNSKQIHQNAKYWCNLKVAQKEGVAVLPDSIQHSTCEMHRESGIHEVRRRIIHQSV